MNRKQYNSDPRYAKVLEKMDLLGIMDITTTRQHKNGTIVWKLPIKNNHRPASYIEVASFSTGYVRNQNSGYSNYQLNKRCEGEPEFFDSGKKDSIGRTLYTQFTTRSCVLIPIEIDRLEYLISYCLKNYYIKRANQVVEGKYVSQWYHDWSLERANETYSENTGAMARISELEDRIYELESQVDVADNKLSNAISPTKYEVQKTYSKNLEQTVHDLKAKLNAIHWHAQRIADHG